MSGGAGLVASPGTGSRSDQCSWSQIRTVSSTVCPGTTARVWHYTRLTLLLSFRLHGHRIRRAHRQLWVSKVHPAPSLAATSSMMLFAAAHSWQKTETSCFIKS